MYAASYDESIVEELYMDVNFEHENLKSNASLTCISSILQANVSKVDIVTLEMMYKMPNDGLTIKDLEMFIDDMMD